MKGYRREIALSPVRPIAPRSQPTTDRRPRTDRQPRIASDLSGGVALRQNPTRLGLPDLDPLAEDVPQFQQDDFSTARSGPLEVIGVERIKATVREIDQDISGLGWGQGACGV